MFRLALSPLRMVLGRALLLWLALNQGAAFAAPPPLHLVSDVWPPFTDVESKPREAINLVESALLRGGIQSEVSILKWSAAAANLEQGRADGSAAIWKDAAREKYLLFSKPYLENRLVLVTRKGGDVSATSIGMLAGKRLALTKGYAYGDAITKAANVQIVYRDTDADCLRAVLAQQADYVLLDELMVNHLFQFYTEKAQALIVAGKVPLVQRGLHFALNKAYPGARAILDEFDRNIERMLADGTYNRLLHVPWIQADVDGDGKLEYVASTQLALASRGDPRLAQTAYGPVHAPPPITPASAPNTGRAPAYLIDGKSYDNWGDASASLPASDKPAQSGMYKYSTGFVLGQF